MFKDLQDESLVIGMGRREMTQAMTPTCVSKGFRSQYRCCVGSGCLASRDKDLLVLSAHAGLATSISLPHPSKAEIDRDLETVYGVLCIIHYTKMSQFPDDGIRCHDDCPEPC
ncbi:hypothetical protein FVEG_07161 [Fusarium verticillioides 7600]|uniref:Uncharacterized protein n=1 Tax=Gibberella moniliformis (strain M3125 / FGSC 7600) TaxID=334819 RepID=W7MQJ1_GIBM7|nr:hypothetical protein FVEG_07161 [Fusarium verticillioides 7600]EWG46877.1 hypothetical protein FVEG_07161 [Fusarium verticillioides 7600]